MSSSTSGCLFSAALALLAACGSAPAPVVDSVSFLPAAPDAQGNRSALGAIAAHAEAGSIDQLLLAFDPGTQQAVNLYQGPPLEVAGIPSPYQVTLAFRPAVPPGNYSLRVTALDSSGAASAPFPAELVLP